MQPSTQNLSISSNEDDVRLLVNGQVHNAPVQLELPRNKSVNIQAMKDGYYTANMNVGTKLSGTGIADIAGGFIFILPFLGLFSSGAWSLEQENVTMNMVSKEK